MSRRWRSKHDGYNTRQHVWACLSCNATYSSATSACEACGHYVQYFASTQEFRRYRELQVLQQAKQISGLQVQPRYDVVINGHKVTQYRADFKYVEGDQVVVEDVKPSLDEKSHSDVFKLKKKLVEAVFGITITITT